MTRKSKRELERDVEHPRARYVPRAEREGREILGPADVAADSDFVRVDPNG